MSNNSTGFVVNDLQQPKYTENKDNDLAVKPINSNFNKAKSVSDFIARWQEDFTEAMRVKSNSKKRDFNYTDAILCTALISEPIDKAFIKYIGFIEKSPLLQNDYFKYVNSYVNGKKLNPDYFSGSLEKLEEYYQKADNAKAEERPYTAFSQTKWKAYVLYMVLKLEGVYTASFDGVFGVKYVKSREYNPMTNLASVMRAYLPFTVKEYDIVQAFPSIACIDAEIKPIDEVYKKLDKKVLNTLLNTHKGVKNAPTLEQVRAKLKPAFGDITDTVMSEERFNNKGQLFEDFAKYEKQYIERFAKENGLKNYVRLHDALVVKTGIDCDVLKIGELSFKSKQIAKPKRYEAKKMFYSFDEQGKPFIRPSEVKNFFIQEDFIRITEAEKDQVTIIKNENKVLKPYNHISDSGAFLSKNINELYPDAIEDLIAAHTRTIQSSFLLMQPVPYRLHRDSKKVVYKSFKNGVAKITADEVEMIPYSDERVKFFAEHDTQKHNFEFKHDFADRSEFKDFITNAVIGRDIRENEQLTIKESDDMLGFLSMIGYLSSNYKDSSRSHAIIFSDKGANNDTRKGRRGKSLLQEALKHFNVTNDRGGVDFDPTYRHCFANLKEKHDLCIVDDVAASFKYDSLYSLITGGVIVEGKGVEAKQIPFDMAPKFVISTNWAVQYDRGASSTNWRFKEYQFTDFYNIDNRPDQYFGSRLFDDWSAEQWNDFYCFMTSCIQMYLKDGLIEVEKDKKLDNYNALFFSDMKLQEFERIYNDARIDKDQGFTVTDFFDIHREKFPYSNDRMFRKNNILKYLNVYAEYYGLIVLKNRRRNIRIVEKE